MGTLGTTLPNQNLDKLKENEGKIWKKYTNPLLTWNHLTYTEKVCLAFLSEQFFSDNRDGTGQSKKVHQNIKHGALHEINSFDNIHKNLLTIQEKLKKKDKTECLAKGLAFRKIFGFIHNLN